MTVFHLLGSALPLIHRIFPPVPLPLQVQNIPMVLLAVLLYGLGATYLALWRAAPDYRVFRILGAFSITVGTVQALAYFGGSVPSVSVRGIATALLVETAGEAMQVPNRRWTRFFWPLYLFAVIAAWIPSIAFAADVPIVAAAIPLGILIVQGFYRGNARDRMVATAFSVYFVVRLTLSDGLQRLTGISGGITIGAWRWPVAISTHFLLVAVTLVIFVRDLINDRREKQRMAAELAAARAVQQVLIPDHTPTVPGFNIQSVYKPFGEVGGDFFQIIATSNGGALAVIGDVSGKGISAAMTVSLLVGTVRTLAHYTQSPGEILAAMNLRMLGRTQGGFTTCLVLRADPDGALTVANAGHIAPYLAGRELSLENGLPLGLAAESTYPESTFQLAAEAQLTFLTDGVVEARDKDGALFGFDRTAAISRDSAEEVAQAAQAFGQEDDITVLTLTFAPATRQPIRRCMLRTLARLAPAVLVCFVALPAVATPPAPPSVQAQHALSLEPTDCVYREGDDLSWAAANLDESKWQPIADWPGIATRTPYYWLRCRFNPSQLSSDVSPAIQVSGDLSYEIYVDGQLAGSFGNLITGAHTVGEVRDFEPGALSSRGHDIQVALRMAFTPETLEIQPMPQLTLGDAGYMRGQYSRQVAADLSKRWVSWVSCGLIGAAGLFFLSLFWFDRSQTYLLWAGLAWLCIADLRLNEFLHYASIPYPSGLEALLYSAQFSVFFSIFLFFRLAGKPVNRFFRSIQVVLFASSVLFLPLPFLPLRLEMELRWLLDVSPWPGAVVQTAWVIGSTAPLFAFWPLHKLRGSQIATACVSLLWMIIEFAYLLSLFPGIYHADRSGGLQLTTLIQQYRTVVILIVVLTLTFLLIQRLRETNRERAMLAGEMLAAQQIQRALVPASLSTLPDLKIDAVFRPAQEVGGDFYRVRILPGGVQRILIGDVSGKGAAAAMTGAVLLGASEGREAYSPSGLLHHLNRTLSDIGLHGFATCLCLDIDSNGQVRYANAGHIAPYRAGAECPSEPGLPLGLMFGFVYAETTLQLAPGDSLTLLTDGVVEATNPITRELFGFDRTAAISTQSAENIATAAQRFGQEDDITVLTLTFAPVEVLRA